MNLLNDIYYQTDYAQLYADKNASVFTFKYCDGDSVFSNVAIKRPITHIGSKKCADIYYDLETPYGYGGIYTNTDNYNFIEQAYSAYKTQCLKEKIIAEFTRFHPFNDFSQKHSNRFDFLAADRAVVVVDLKTNREARWAQYKPNTRNILRKCTKELVFQESQNISEFEKLYKKTMLKNNANDFYYFNTQYYRDLLNIDGVHLYQVSVGKTVIAMAFFMFGKELAHYHLSANNTEYLKLNGNYFMLDQAFNEAQKRRLTSFMLGGGRSRDLNDSLLQFKKKFSKSTKQFYIAGIKHNEIVYNEYITQWEQMSSNKIKYFLKYRLGED